MNSIERNGCYLFQQRYHIKNCDWIILLYFSYLNIHYLTKVIGYNYNYYDVRLLAIYFSSY